jgi:RNA polymerase sigma-70 factor, ECF subfamily
MMEMTMSDTEWAIGITKPYQDEADLIGRAQRGDLDAFNILVERYQRRVYGLCFRMLGDVASAEDATQDAVFSAWRSIRRFQGGSLIAWLLRIASNRCYDILRARSRRTFISLDLDGGDDTSGPLQIADQRETPEEHALRAEIAREVEQLLRTLPPDYCLVLTLCDIDGYSYQEIVNITGWPLGTVKSRLNRARAQLRGTLRLAKQRLADQHA